MPDPRSHEEARKWLAHAATDLRIANLLLSARPPEVGGALYHCQQAAEKALKAFLLFNGRRYPLTHDLGALLSLCSEIEPDLESKLKRVVRLTEYATIFRYPGDMEQPSLDEGMRCLELARELLTEIQSRLFPEANC